MSEKLLVAEVLKPQGIKGEIKVKTFTDSADDLKKIKTLYIGGEPYQVMAVRTQPDTAYIALKGVADRNTAELLRGKKVEAMRSDCPELPEGRFYIADLIGAEVQFENGESVGKVLSVTPARTDVYVLSTPKGELTFAAADGVIADIDVESGKIIVNKKRFKEVSI